MLMGVKKKIQGSQCSILKKSTYISNKHHSMPINNMNPKCMYQFKKLK